MPAEGIANGSDRIVMNAWRKLGRCAWRNKALIHNVVSTLLSG
jgi:hypothetical protein